MSVFSLVLFVVMTFPVFPTEPKTTLFLVGKFQHPRQDRRLNSQVTITTITSLLLNQESTLGETQR